MKTVVPDFLTVTLAPDIIVPEYFTVIVTGESAYPPDVNTDRYGYTYDGPLSSVSVDMYVNVTSILEVFVFPAVSDAFAVIVVVPDESATDAEYVPLDNVAFTPLTVTFAMYVSL